MAPKQIHDGVPHHWRMSYLEVNPEVGAPCLAC